MSRPSSDRERLQRELLARLEWVAGVCPTCGALIEQGHHDDCAWLLVTNAPMNGEWKLKARRVVRLTMLMLIVLSAIVMVACDAQAERARILCLISGTPCPGAPMK